MNNNHLHIFIYLLVIASCNQVFATCLSQDTEITRFFDDEFKTRYSSDKFDYEGEAVVGYTPSGSGNYEDFKNGKPKQKEQNNNNQLSLNLGPLSWLFVLAITGAVLYLVYILLNEGGSGLFSTKKTKTINSYDNITAENIEDTDINTLIKNAESNNDFRLAVRYYYLLVLKTLSLKNHIKYEDDKTNSEYLNEINGKIFSNDFEYTSYLYNYIWYGEFHLTLERYEKAKTNFETLLKQVEK